MNEDCLTLLIGTAGAGKTYWEETRPPQLPSRAIEVTGRTKRRIRMRGRATADTHVDDALRNPAGKVIETRFTHATWRRVLFASAAAAKVPVIAVLVHTADPATVQTRITKAQRKHGGNAGVFYKEAAEQLMRNVATHALQLTALTCVDTAAEPRFVARIDRRKRADEQEPGTGTWAEPVTAKVLEAWNRESVRRPQPNSIHPRAHVNPRARLGTRIRIGRHADIARYATIGERTRISAYAVVQQWTRLGAANTLRRHAQVGTRCTTGAGVVLGEASVIRHGCRIGDRTEIGERASIDANTTIGDDVRIGKRCHIEQDCHIGDGAQIEDGTRVPAGTRIEAGKGAELVGTRTGKEQTQRLATTRRRPKSTRGR